MTRLKPTLVCGAQKDNHAQPAKSKATIRNRGALTPQMKTLITEDCRARGCVQTAKIWGVTVGLCLELRIEALNKVIDQTHARIAAMERRMAA